MKTEREGQRDGRKKGGKEREKVTSKENICMVYNKI